MKQTGPSGYIGGGRADKAAGYVVVILKVWDLSFHPLQTGVGRCSTAWHYHIPVANEHSGDSLLDSFGVLLLSSLPTQNGV